MAFGGGTNTNIGSNWKQETVDRDAYRKVAFAQEGSYHLVHIPVQNQCSDLCLAQGEENTDGVLRKVNMSKSSWPAAMLIPCLCERCTLLWPFLGPRGTELVFQWQKHKPHIHIYSSAYQLNPVKKISSFQRMHNSLQMWLEPSQSGETHLTASPSSPAFTCADYQNTNSSFSSLVLTLH